MLSKHFSLKEALYLPSWNREATEADGLDDAVRANLKDLFSKLDSIREFFNKPIHVHVAFRPKAYNAQIGGAKNSAHLSGRAVDFHVQGIECDEARKMILDANMLEKLGLRMECLPGSAWIHLDTAEPKPNRYFKP